MYKRRVGRQDSFVPHGKQPGRLRALLDARLHGLDPVGEKGDLLSKLFDVTPGQHPVFNHSWEHMPDNRQR